ncbi:hypothetical protein C8J57DRAFT_1229985 [Mycena rebaudengoi]|nr:hypothetical protein C8J57DRAFT_1229985 [Mycena rebaudengoi]
MVWGFYSWRIEDLPEGRRGKLDFENSASQPEKTEVSMDGRRRTLEKWGLRNPRRWRSTADGRSEGVAQIWMRGRRVSIKKCCLQREKHGISPRGKKNPAYNIQAHPPAKPQSKDESKRGSWGKARAPVQKTRSGPVASAHETTEEGMRISACGIARRMQHLRHKWRKERNHRITRGRAYSIDRKCALCDDDYAGRARPESAVPHLSRHSWGARSQIMEPAFAPGPCIREGTPRTMWTYRAQIWGSGDGLEWRRRLKEEVEGSRG